MMPPPFACYSLATMRPLMLSPLLLLLACILHLGCGDDGGPADPERELCLPDTNLDSYWVSGLLEPCVGDQNCIVGACRHGLCSEPCKESGDCVGDARCEPDGYCTYTCATDLGQDAISCSGYDLNAERPSMRCEAGVCVSTFTCDEPR